MPENKKCQHPACTCQVAEGSKFCSQYCHDAGGTMELSCNCGHAGCSLESAAGGVPGAVE